MDEKTKMQRWRLILGNESQNRFSNMGGGTLEGELDLMDQALASIYNRREAGGFGNHSSGAGLGPSNPQISKWLGDVRSLFDKEKAIWKCRINWKCCGAAVFRVF